MILISLSGFSGGASGKESTCQCRRHKTCRFDPWVGEVPGEGNGNLLQYSCLGNPMDTGAWWATVHGVEKSRTWLSNWMHKTIRGKLRLPQEACDEQRSRAQKTVLLPCVHEAPPDSLSTLATSLLPGRSRLDIKALYARLS